MKTILTATLAAAMLLPLGAYAEGSKAGQLLQGDEKLACEAIMCLSSGNRPAECNESIHRYFSIQHKKTHETINARRDFLNKCPSSNEQGMPQLVNALANGAGRCNAAELNRLMRATYQVKVCKKKQPAAGTRNSNYGGMGTGNGRNRIVNDEECELVTKTYIRNAKPGYCKAYFEHGWTTTGDKVRYIGEEKNGGKWVDQ